MDRVSAGDMRRDTWRSVTCVRDFRTRTAPTARARTASCRLFGSRSPAFGIDTGVIIATIPSSAKRALRTAPPNSGAVSQLIAGPKIREPGAF
jgi:hypothetical protein